LRFQKFVDFSDLIAQLIRDQRSTIRGGDPQLEARDLQAKLIDTMTDLAAIDEKLRKIEGDLETAIEVARTASEQLKTRRREYAENGTFDKTLLYYYVSGNKHVHPRSFQKLYAFLHIMDLFKRH
jgi:hypothetical protein